MFEWASSFEIGVRFKCLRCGSCCKHIQHGVGLTYKDYIRIRKASKSFVGSVNIVRSINNPIYSFSLNGAQTTCPFLDGKSCLIYNNRPLNCRLYPFQIGVRHDGKLLLCLNHCPGVGQPEGIIIDERYIEDEILKTILRLESEIHIERLRKYFLKTKSSFTPLLETTIGLIYSDWKAKGFLEQTIFNLLQSDLFCNLTPWERLWCIQNGALPLFSAHFSSNGETIVTQQDVMKGYESIKRDICSALDAYASLRKEFRERIEQEGCVVYEHRDKQCVAYKPDDKIWISNFTGEEFHVCVGDILKVLPISHEAIDTEISYLREIVRRESFYGATVCDISIDKEILLLMNVADALELSSNAFTVRRNGSYVGITEIVDAIKNVDGSLTTFARRIAY